MEALNVDDLTFQIRRSPRRRRSRSRLSAAGSWSSRLRPTPGARCSKALSGRSVSGSTRRWPRSSPGCSRWRPRSSSAARASPTSGAATGCCWSQSGTRRSSWRRAVSSCCAHGLRKGGRSSSVGTPIPVGLLRQGGDRRLPLGDHPAASQSGGLRHRPRTGASHRAEPHASVLAAGRPCAPGLRAAQDLARGARRPSDRALRMLAQQRVQPAGDRNPDQRALGGALPARCRRHRSRAARGQPLPGRPALARPQSVLRVLRVARVIGDGSLRKDSIFTFRCNETLSVSKHRDGCCGSERLAQLGGGHGKILIGIFLEERRRGLAWRLLNRDQATAAERGGSQANQQNLEKDHDQVPPRHRRFPLRDHRHRR